MIPKVVGRTTAATCAAWGSLGSKLWGLGLIKPVGLFCLLCCKTFISLQAPCKTAEAAAACFAAGGDSVTVNLALDKYRCAVAN